MIVDLTGGRSGSCSGEIKNKAMKSVHRKLSLHMNLLNIHLKFFFHLKLIIMTYHISDERLGCVYNSCSYPKRHWDTCGS